MDQSLETSMDNNLDDNLKKAYFSVCGQTKSGNFALEHLKLREKHCCTENI